MQGYKQCRLMHSGADAIHYQIAFIPVELANEGKILIPKDDTRSWIVVYVAHDCIVTEDTLMSFRRAWKDWERVCN